MVAGTSARESVKEMKRLKNEPLLLLVIIAIILFVGIFVIYPVVKVILFPVQGGDRRGVRLSIFPVYRPVWAKTICWLVRVGGKFIKIFPDQKCGILF